MIVRIETIGLKPGWAGATVRIPADGLVRVLECQGKVQAANLKVGQHYCFAGSSAHAAEITSVVME